MAVLLIGFEAELYYVANVMNQTERVDCLFWSDYHGPEQLIAHELKQYECIVLAFQERQVAEGLQSILVEEYEIAMDHILDFYAVYMASVPLMVCERRMIHPEIPKYKGMILGISHAEVGILSRLLKYPFCNMAVSSQDLFYNMKTLEYCINRYYDRIEALEYLIIDMFDYTYFNFDVSLSKNASSYYIWGGYHLDPHHFNENKSFTLSHDDVMKRILNEYYGNINDRVIDCWEKYFGTVHQYNGYSSFSDYINISYRMNTYAKIQGEDDILVNRSIAQKVFSDTIEENINCFRRILELAYELNPNMKVYAMIMPRYAEIRDKIRVPMERWKDFFNKQIQRAQDKYPLTFLDLSEHELSNRVQYYQDGSHLNYLGAVQFTGWMNESLLD